jgi:hypothetical protein
MQRRRVEVLLDVRDAPVADAQQVAHLQIERPARRLVDTVYRASTTAPPSIARMTSGVTVNPSQSRGIRSNSPVRIACGPIQGVPSGR